MLSTNLNKPQHLVVGALAIAILVTVLFPPWKLACFSSGYPWNYKLGHAFILTPPPQKSAPSCSPVLLDWPRLLAMLGFAIVIAGIILRTLRTIPGEAGAPVHVKIAHRRGVLALLLSLFLFPNVLLLWAALMEESWGHLLRETVVTIVSVIFVISLAAWYLLVLAVGWILKRRAKANL